MLGWHPLPSFPIFGIEILADRVEGFFARFSGPIGREQRRQPRSKFRRIIR